MSLAFLHGESIIFGIILVAVLFWPSALALFVWKRRYLTQHRWQVIFGYLLLVALSSSPLLSDDSDFLGFILGTAFTLPWALFVPQLLGVVEKPALAASLVLCGVINSALFYFAANFLNRRDRGEVLEPVARLRCPHCGEENIVAGCKTCGKSYVITTAHIEGRVRDAQSGPVSHLNAVLIGHACDTCLAKYYGNEAEAERQQRTCAACHQECLPLHGR